MSGVIRFLDSPLVTWVKTFSLGKDLVTFQDVSDAVYLLDVLNSIDERNTEEEMKKLKRFAKDPNARLQNWALLIHLVTEYYLEVLQQAVVMKTPDVFSIVEDPTKEESLAELEKVLLLLLGCAVQCEKKEQHINAIKSLDISAQKALVGCIKQVTDSGENVLPLDSDADSDDTKQLYLIVRKTVTEKEQLFQQVVQLKQERDYHANEVSKKFGDLSAPPSLENYHLLRELQACKAKQQRQTVQLEEKGKSICELKEDLQHSEKEISKIRSEKLKLEKDARLARSYRDEVDNLKERALKVEKLEKELTRFKEKVHELDYYKSRVEELREDNSLLCECKEKLEEQGSQSQTELCVVRQDVEKLQAAMDRMSKEKTDLEQKLSEALEENATLDFEKARMSEGYTGPLKRMVSYTSSEFLQASQQQLEGQPISDELNDSMSSHVTRLEVENGELKHELEQIKSKLFSTQQEVEILINQSERDYNNKKLQNTAKDSQQRQFQEALERRCDVRISELQSVINQKNGQLEKCEGKLCESERAKKCLERQGARLEEQWCAAQTKCEDLYTETKQLKRELQQNKRQITTMRETAQQVAVLQRKLNAMQDSTEELAILQKKLTSMQDASEQVEILQKKLNSMRDSTEQVRILQRDKEDLIQQLSSIHAQISKEKEQSISMQRDNNDLIQRLTAQQSHWDRDRESCVNLEREKANLQTENQQLKHNLDSLRDCSEQHIKELEEQIVSLQDKSVAIENLNDYLNNLSMVDTMQDIEDTDLDAHLDISNAKDNNHNNKPNHFIVDKSTESNGQEVPGPQCSTPQSIRRHGDRSSNMSLSQVDEYAIDSSQLYGNDRPTKITYVKRNASFSTSSHDSERPGSNNFINKLKSYVKPYKNDGKGSESSLNKSGNRTPLQEMQLREDRGFVRNSRHRSTVHGQPMADKSPSLRRDKIRTPVSHSSTSRPVSAPFSRSHSLRQTMPERRRHPVRPPSEHASSHRDLNSSHHSQISQDSLMQSRSSSQSSSGQNYHPPTHYRNNITRDYSSDLDSGLGVSAEQYQAAAAAGAFQSQKCSTGSSSSEHQDSGQHRGVTSIEVTSTETVESHWKQVSSSSTRGSSEKLQALAEKVKHLQDQNQALLMDNAELKKVLESSSKSGGMSVSSHKQLQQLQAENRKLRIIVETLQNTLSGRNPYDDKEYHYFTNV